MPHFRHPSGLNLLQRYWQARSFHNRTSRAKNPAWYLPALEHPYQLHIRTDGANVSAFLLDQAEDLWAPGPPLTENDLLDPETITAYVFEAVKHARDAKGKSLGVILHIADEFALTEIKPEFTDREELGKLRDKVITDPSETLTDSVTASQASSRLIPCFSARSPAIATAVSLSHRYHPALHALRALGDREDFPVITAALSAPLIALLGIHGSVGRTPGRPSVSVLQYPSFTVLAIFDENSDLIQLRSQQHRGLRRPPNFGHTLATIHASLELDQPDIFIFPLGAEADRTLIFELRSLLPECHIEEVHPRFSSPLPAWCAECLIATHPPAIEDPLPGITLRTFREDRWALQDFLPATKEAAEVFPTRREMNLMTWFRAARIAAVALSVLAIVWIFQGLFGIIRTPEWAFDPADVKSVQERLIFLNAEKKKLEQWDTLLADRSKGWAVLESLTRLFPENSGLLVSSFNHTTRPDSTRGQQKTGFTREWKISGLLTDQAVELLNRLNTREGITERFDEIARITGNEAYRTDTGTRSLTINIRRHENRAFNPNAPSGTDLTSGSGARASGMPLAFEITITQRFEATDPLAVEVAKVPSNTTATPAKKPR